MRRRRQGGHLRDKSNDLTVEVLRVVDVLGLGVIGRECRDGGDQHTHGVCVVVETFEESLAHVLVNEGVIRDVLSPLIGLLLVRQLTVEEQVGHFEVGRLLGQLLDGVSAIAQDAGVTIEVGHRAFGGRRGHETRVVEPHTGHQLRKRRGGHATVLDGNVNTLASAVVSESYRFRHRRLISAGLLPSA